MSEQERLERTKARDWAITELEPLFDAAILRASERILLYSSHQ
jgi:hypothetical protein